VSAEQKSATESEDLISIAVDVELSMWAARNEIWASFLFDSSREPHNEEIGEREARMGRIIGVGIR
jgi:hypothetical protein